MTPDDRTERAATFLAMHLGPTGFVLPNAWDPGSARILEDVGFDALATTSAGIAFAHGRRDGAMSGPEMLSAVADIVAAVSCPVTADLEAGYGASLEQVARTVAEAVAVGAVGANIEDRDPSTDEAYPIDEAADRIAAARSAAPVGSFVLNARIDSFLLGSGRTTTGALADDAVARAARYVGAGADCVFVPGVDDHPTVTALVEAIDAPVNVVVGLANEVPDITALLALGVARISVGGSLARAALGFVERAGRDLLAGQVRYPPDAIEHAALQLRFSRPSRHLETTE